MVLSGARRCFQDEVRYEAGRRRAAKSSGQGSQETKGPRNASES